METKKEIFNRHATKHRGELIMTEPSAMEAMNEHARQAVIHFAEWVNENYGAYIPYRILRDYLKYGKP